MFKKILIALSILILASGCVSTLPGEKPQKRSVAQQHERAQKAFDELDGKSATARPVAPKAPEKVSPRVTPPREPKSPGRITPDYSSPRFLTAKGFGMSKPEAIRQAKAELSNIFESHIQSDITSRVKSVTDSAGGDSLNRTFQSSIQVASDVELQGVEIGKIWKEGSEYVALAALDKEKAADKWSADIHRTDSEISVQMEQADKSRGKLVKLKHLKKAMALSFKREATLSRLRVLGYDHSSRFGSLELKPLLEKISANKNTMRIDLDVSGQYGRTVRDKVAEILTDKGFKIGDFENRADVLITGDVKTKPVRNRNKNFKFSRAFVSLNIVDTISGSQVGQIAVNERGAHLNYDEAARVAIKKASKKVSEKLIGYFN